MKASLSQDLIASLGNQNLTIYDTKFPGLQLRLRATGVHTYRVQIGRGDYRTLGRADALKPAAARVAARNELSAAARQRAEDSARGLDPVAEARKRRAARRRKALTFDQFFREHYKPWGEVHLKSHASTIGALEREFVPLFGAEPLTAIDPFRIERWRSKRLKGGATAPTANKDLSALKAALNWAVDHKLITAHQLQGRAVKPLRQDRLGRVRFLTVDEETTLRKALTARDVDLIHGRANANAWRRARGYKELPELGPFGDHLTPVVLLGLNSGCRRGELLALRWTDVDLVAARLTVRGETAKSGRTRHIPLNAEAVAVLKDWQDQATGDLVFPGEDGETMFSLKTAWGRVLKAAAKTAPTIADFRFHDLRHTFASKLVQAGVDLYVVKALLGHSDFMLTARYAHLRAEDQAAAVAKLAAR